MALVIEDGTGKPTANSYATAASCLAYALARGKTFTDDATGEAALIRATAWLDAAYLPRWRGYRTHSRAQGLAWPRTGASDIEGNSIASDAIPSEVINACCEAAIAELATPNALSPSFVPAKGIKSASVDGAVAVTYRDGATDANAQRMALTAVDDALATLIGVLPKPALFGESGRA